MKKHVILFLAANPRTSDPRRLAEECAEIQRELKMAPHRDDFQFESRWAVSIDELMRHLNELAPTVIHFSGHDEGEDGLLLQNEQGYPQPVSGRALAMMIDAAGRDARVVVLNACYSTAQAEALRAKVECVVGMDGKIGDGAARAFAIRFYGALGNRRSIGNAVDQGIAALAAKQLPDEVLPRCVTREGADKYQVVLDIPSSWSVASPMGVSEASRIVASPAAVPSAPSKVDIGILTIRDDEFRAVLSVFPDKTGTVKGAHREYTLRHADAGNGERYTITVLRQVEQGHGEAQTVARDLIEDLTPRLVLVVGIAGGLPSDDVTLGDVVLSTRIHDFTVEARKTGHEVTYAAAGGPIDRALANVVADLANRDDELGGWTADLPARPAVTWTRKGQLYGPPEWQRELRAKLAHHHGTGTTPRAPVYVAGPIASSDRLVKDPTLLIPWLATVRNLLAIEMESGGVYRAVRERCPMLAIRGISDIVGLTRVEAWTKYACASVAAFTRAFLRTRPIPVGSSGVAVDPR